MVVLVPVGKGKKNKQKVKNSEKQTFGPGRFDGPGDLRAVRYHVDQWRKHGVEEARNMLMMLGRDAAFTVSEIAEERKDEELIEFGRRLIAVKPQIESNLNELRRASVDTHVERARASAVPAVDITGFSVEGGSFGLFDPARLADDLVKGGRPRKDAARLNAGDVAWFGLPTVDPIAVRFTTQPPETEALRMRLRVDSGVVFAGAPEACDGPRLGTVRRDPHHTQLDEHLAEGRFLRMKPGVYRIDARREGGAVIIHLQPDPDPDASLDLDPSRVSLPDPVDERGAGG